MLEGRGARLGRPALPLAALTLAALALLGLETPARAHTYCAALDKLNHDIVQTWGEQSVSVRGRASNVVLYWGSEPAHAAAALLLVLLRHVRRYCRLRLERAPHRLRRLSEFLDFEATANYTDLAISISTAWEPGPAPSWSPGSGKSGGLAGPRLYEFGASPVPARRRLHAWLAPPARARRDCRRLLWTTLTNATARAHCHFMEAPHYQSITGPGGGGAAPATLEVVGVGEWHRTLQLLQERAPAAPLALRTRLLNRTEFLRHLRRANHSFLFLDYDMWQGEERVTVAEPPPCLADLSDCQRDLDPTIGMRVADVDILQAYAPQLFEFVHDFTLTPTDLRAILERNISGLLIEEAACERALNNNRYGVQMHYKLINYLVEWYYCKDEPNNYNYKKILSIKRDELLNQTKLMGWVFAIMPRGHNCSDPYDLSKQLDYSLSIHRKYRLLGVVAHAGVGALAASATAAAHSLPLMLADVVADDSAPASAASTWRVAARPRHVARALQHLVRACRWTRLAVLSQPTTLAKHYYDALLDDPQLILAEFKIPLRLTKPELDKALGSLRDTNARIVFVNADEVAAADILAAAVERYMGYSDGFVWIVRDWRRHNGTAATKHLTVSPWRRGLEHTPDTGGTFWRAPHSVSLAHALVTLIMGSNEVFRHYPNMRKDLRNDHVIRALNDSLVNSPVRDVNNITLYYKGRSIEESFVYVDEWCGGHLTQRLAAWRVNATSGVVLGQDGSNATLDHRPGDLPTDDGRSHCIVQTGEPFHPNCHDAKWVSALVLVLLVPIALYMARREFRRRLARLKREQELQAIARRRHVATVLAAYLVDRAALELQDEIGAGRFGSVRMALLATPGRDPRYIAAKALRENAAPAEESEFLREACTIASLDHAHVVRLVGVCIADGPPLVLMELALFGDLHGYLRARRHLVERGRSEALAAGGEAAHVSAAALTRLAREAAEALQYLGSRGVVHRDVRAANCLVDAQRSLKLADFGMARDTVAGADGAPEYACRRRGLFPVLWMAPESLAHGVFSAASDMWAFGVLVLELVTLGARPYGAWSPLRVLEHVAAGGLPPLPLDATPQTRGLARLCWQRAAERRPSAAEVADYLAKWPQALRPALLCERDVPDDGDNAYRDTERQMEK